MDHVRNDDIRAQLRQEGVVEQVGRKREVWKKRVEEQIGSMTEMVMSGTVPGKRLLQTKIIILYQMTFLK